MNVLVFILAMIGLNGLARVCYGRLKCISPPEGEEEEEVTYVGSILGGVKTYVVPLHVYLEGFS